MKINFGITSSKNCLYLLTAQGSHVACHPLTESLINESINEYKKEIFKLSN